MAETSESKYWIETGDSDLPRRGELIKLYDVFQVRQIADLDMVHRYANYYVAVLLAILTAFVLGLTRADFAPVAGLLVILPVLSFMLSQQGKLMAFRFYRRYNEGRMRLTKIEYLLGLHGHVKSSRSIERDYPLWSDDKAFVLGRYINEAKRESSSCRFVQRRSYVPRFWQVPGSTEKQPFGVWRMLTGMGSRFWEILSKSVEESQESSGESTETAESGYGAGYIIHTTFTFFSMLSVMVVIALPIGLCFVHKLALEVKACNFLYSALALGVLWFYIRWYSRTLYRMERETPDAQEPQASGELSNTEQP